MSPDILMSLRVFVAVLIVMSFEISIRKPKSVGFLLHVCVYQEMLVVVYGDLSLWKNCATC